MAPAAPATRSRLSSTRTSTTAARLDGKYTVFGKVVSGMNIVDTVKKGDKMKSVKILDASQ